MYSDEAAVLEEAFVLAAVDCCVLASVGAPVVGKSEPTSKPAKAAAAMASTIKTVVTMYRLASGMAKPS